jgi:hypothetical protein
MRKLYIGLSRTHKGKIGSVLLQKYMGTPYSHTFFEFDTQRLFGDTTIFHSAMSSGVSYWSNTNFEKINYKTHLYEIEIEDDTYRKIRAKLHRHAGDQYAFLQNIGILFFDFFKNLGISIKNPFRKNENCSELIFIALVELHPELKEQYDPNTIRPDHIHDILEKYNYKRIR